MLLVLILLPAVFALLIALLPRTLARLLGLIGAGLTGLLSLGTLLDTTPEPIAVSGSTMVFNWTILSEWMPELGVRFHLGVDSVSGLLCVLTALLGLVSIAMPFKIADGRERPYYSALLATVSATIGAFCALDLLLFYGFFEASLVPIFLLIGVFGGRGGAKAAMKFFLYTVAGSLLMLAALFTLRSYAGSFDYGAIAEAVSSGKIPAEVLGLIFLGFAAAFAVKTPLFPFHTWLPDAYAACPAAGVALLSGAMAKMGAYGFLRFGIELMPATAARYAPLLVLLAAVGVVYGALVASVQRDVKRVIAYSSVSHLGYVLLGLFCGDTNAQSGAVLQMVNHGITTGALFLIVGLIEERQGTLSLNRLGGLWGQMPVFGRVFLIITLSSIALPLTNGFVGEFLILLGAFQTYPLAAAVATTGAIWSAVYMLGLFQKVMYGPAKNDGVRDLDVTERMVLGAVVVLIFAIGLAPSPFLKMIHGSLGPAASLNAGLVTTERTQ